MLVRIFMCWCVVHRTVSKNHNNVFTFISIHFRNIGLQLMCATIHFYRFYSNNNNKIAQIQNCNIWKSKILTNFYKHCEAKVVFCNSKKNIYSNWEIVSNVWKKWFDSKFGVFRWMKFFGFTFRSSIGCHDPWH